MKTNKKNEDKQKTLLVIPEDSRRGFENTINAVGHMEPVGPIVISNLETI